MRKQLPKGFLDEVEQIAGDHPELTLNEWTVAAFAWIATQIYDSPEFSLPKADVLNGRLGPFLGKLRGTTKDLRPVNDATVYSFEMLWSDYGYKVGSKSKAAEIYRKLSEQDRAAIRKAVPKYVSETVTSDPGPGAKFVPFRTHLTTFLNQRRWESIVETVQESCEVLTGKLVEQYDAYCGWVLTKYQGADKYRLSQAQFLKYKQLDFQGPKDPVKYKQAFELAHYRVAAGKDTGDVFQIFNKLNAANAEQ